MKKILPILCAAFMGATIFSACEKNVESDLKEMTDVQYGDVTIEMASDGMPSTKVAAEGRLETAINDKQFAIYRDRYLYAYLDNATKMRLPYGIYSVRALANGPKMNEYCEDERTLFGMPIDYSTYNNTSNGLVQYGCLSTGFTVDAPSGNTCTVNVKRLVSRIRLTSISVTDSLPAAYKNVEITGAYLCNVKGGNLSVDNTYSVLLNRNVKWLNPCGRPAASLSNKNACISEQYPADNACATYWAPSSPVTLSVPSTRAMNVCLYASPNDCTSFTDNSSTRTLPNNFNQATVLCVSARVNNGSTNAYYPVNLRKLEPNTSYDVSLTIRNIGTSDPATPLQFGAASITINPAEWIPGSDINEIM